jgi:NAD(P)H-dependent flavin oxidoreductase YrpB (nitropropane dioxygenase family)
MKSAAAQQGRAEFLSLCAGQGARLARRQSAAELVARLVQETATAIERLQFTRKKLYEQPQDPPPILAKSFE